MLSKKYVIKSGCLHFPAPGLLFGTRPWPWPPALVLNLYLPALSPNLYLQTLAPNLYLPALVPSLHLPVRGLSFAYTNLVSSIRIWICDPCL